MFRSILRKCLSTKLYLGALVIFVGACSSGESDQGSAFLLEQVRPRLSARTGVFLNEALVFHFSEEVDGSSVTRESLVIRPLAGNSATPGRFEIDGQQVRFVPDLGRSRDLSDGGFLPGTRYEVLVRGFPAPDGVQSADGSPLAKSARFYFETAQLSEPRVQMFNDRTPAVGAAMRLEKDHLSGNQSLLLSCPEPLDPSTLVDGEFVLAPADGLLEPVPLDPLLSSNSDEYGAELKLRPRRILGPGRYFLRPQDMGGPGRLPKVSVRDFGGNQVWFPEHSGERRPIMVLEHGDERPEVLASFLSDGLRSPLVVPGVDGAAHWKDDGLVTIRFPRIAGLGTDGFTSLDGPESRSDIHATGLTVSKGTTSTLLSVAGLVVLRAQGKMTIAGNLVRRSGEAVPITRSFERGETSSGWLLRARQQDQNWTVIIAGGDLVIDGDIKVEGPLLLAAGGRIRITGRVRAQASELWLVGEGGGGDISRTASHADLVLDPPFKNPLVNSLTYAVLSSPMPPEGGVSRWRGALVQGEARNGSFSVRYLPHDMPLGSPIEDWGMVDSPSDLLESSSLRILCILRVDPADAGQVKPGLWYPPLIDDVRLSREP